jgi:glyoxylase-like metal-dependent hydrolase (beta-lactamase superfamily II)
MAHRISRFGFVNAYLVEEDDGLTLVDTTLPGGDKAIRAAAERLGKPIVRIALTHGHLDHVGAADALAGDAEVAISARDARILQGDRSLDADEPQAKINGSWGKVKRIDRELAHGDRVGSLEVVASPGHTPGHVAFFDPRDGTLYCGDAYLTKGGVASTGKMHWRFPLPYWGTWHKPTALASARALRDLDPKALAPGHGNVVDDPVAAMEAAL